MKRAIGISIVALVALLVWGMAAPVQEAALDALPLFVTVYYHVEPNHQLFESIEPGNFETISFCLRRMSTELAAINVQATFCVAWLYCDIVCQRNHDPVSKEIVNSPVDTGIETLAQIVAEGHEFACHTHPPIAVTSGPLAYYARPDETCTYFDMAHLHRWDGASAGWNTEFYPGVFEFDDPADAWFGEFIWERTTQSCFRLAEYLGVPVRHANGGETPLLDVANNYGDGINHPHCLAQLRSLINTGFDLISPECMAFYNDEYSSAGLMWSDMDTGYVSYLGVGANCQLYYPDIDGGQLEKEAGPPQGLTFMPVQTKPQAAWMTNNGVPDPNYYDASILGGKGGGGVRWTTDTFYTSYGGTQRTPWGETLVSFPSLAEQFNNAMQRHLTETPRAVNAWGFNHHVVNVMWADLTGLSDNWDKEMAFLGDLADGVADGVANPPRPDLVRFVTMQQLSDIHDDLMRRETATPVTQFDFDARPEGWEFRTVAPGPLHVSHWDDAVEVLLPSGIGIWCPYGESTNYFALWDSLSAENIPYVDNSLYQVDWGVCTNRETTNAVPSVRFRIGLSNQKAFAYTRLYPGEWLPLAESVQQTTHTLLFEPPIAGEGLFLAFSLIDWLDDFRGTSPAGEVQLHEVSVYRYELDSFTHWQPRVIPVDFSSWNDAGAPPYLLPSFSRTTDTLLFSSGVDASQVFGSWNSPINLFTLDTLHLYRVTLNLSSDPQLGGPDLRVRVHTDDYRHAWYTYYVSSYTAGESALPPEAGADYDLYLLLPFASQPCHLSVDLIDFSSTYGGTLTLHDLSLASHLY